MTADPSQPSKLRQIIWLTVKIYLIFFTVCAAISAYLHHEDVSNSNLNPVYWFYPAFALGVPSAVTITIWILFIRDTKYRSRDPYRFSRQQYRFFSVPGRDIPDIRSVLESLGYGILDHFSDSEKIQLKAVRVQPKNLERFYDKKHPSPHNISVLGIKQSGWWQFMIKGDLFSKIALADFRNTVYDSLEELVSALNWEQYLRK